VALQIERIVSWWEANRPESPDLFESELVAMLSSLITFPYRGVPSPRSNGRSSRRVLIVPRTEYRITYEVSDRAREVKVTSIVSSRRRR